MRTPDGFLAAMNALAPRAGSVHRVAFFNPGTNRRMSVLRLVNRTRREAEALIDGTDDLGLRPGTTVRVLVPATDAVELTAAELESGRTRRDRLRRARRRHREVAAARRVDPTEPPC